MLAVKVLTNGGFSATRACVLVGLSNTTFRKYGGMGSGTKTFSERNNEIAELYKSGKTLEDISLVYNLTRERVRQVLRAVGVARKEGGSAIRALSNQVADAAARASAKEARALVEFGCDHETAVRINGGTAFYRQKSPSSAYLHQKRAASVRGVDWQLTFPQWWDIWQQSGKWGMRGRGGDAYCMARKGDAGPYTAESVYITTNRQNSSDSYIWNPACKRFGVTRDELGMTRRQRLIWDLAQAGKHPKDIATELDITIGSVRVHINSAKNILSGKGRQVLTPALEAVA